jgi:hypothetical protein
MASKREGDSYLVQVARIRIETTDVEVAAEDDEAGSLAAVNRAKRMPATAWTIEPCDARSCQPHVQALVTSEELMEGIEDGGSATTREEEVDRSAGIGHTLRTAQGQLRHGRRRAGS